MSSDARSLYAKRNLDALAKFEQRAIVQAKKISFRLRSKALSAIKRGYLPEVTRQMVREALPILSDLMIVTHLSGMKKTPQSLALSVFDKTIQSYKKSLNVDIGKLQAQYRTRAFALLNDVADTIEKDLRTTTLNLIEQGATPKEAQATLRGRFDDLGLTDKKDYQLRTIFRTQSQIAYSAGRWQADQDPAIQEILWGYEYSAVGDDRTRESHMAMDGTTLPKDDPFWQTHWPPNGYNCRCIAIPIYADSVQDVPPPDDAEADDGFDFNAGEVFDGAIALSHYVEGWSFAFDS